MKLKLPKLKQKQKRTLIISLIAFAFFLTFGSQVWQFSPEELTKPLFPDYADYTVTINVLGAGTHTLEAGDTVGVPVNNLVSFTVVLSWNTDKTWNYPEKMVCDMFGGWGSYFDDTDIVNINQGTHTYTWTFDLLDLPTGKFDYHFEFSGNYFDGTQTTMYYGNSFYFYVDKAAPQIMDEAEIELDVPATKQLSVEETYLMSWNYKYEDANRVGINVDGVEVYSMAGLETTAWQIMTWTFPNSPIGVYEVVGWIYPADDESAILYSEITTITVVSVEDDNLIEGLPTGVECTISVVGTIAVINFPSKQVWNAEYSAPIMTPLTGTMAVFLHTASFTAAKVLVFEIDGEESIDEWRLSRSADGWMTTSFYNLDSLPDGEYRFEVRAEYQSTAWYRIATFSMAVRVFPTFWFMQNALFIGILGVATIFAIRGLREAKGWWSFEGKYTKV